MSSKTGHQQVRLALANMPSISLVLSFSEMKTKCLSLGT